MQKIKKYNIKMSINSCANLKQTNFLLYRQYPLYTATIALNGGQECHYYLDESKGWQVNLAELQKSYLKSKNLGINPKILVVINPGNPTGQVMSKSTI